MGLDPDADDDAILSRTADARQAEALHLGRVTPARHG